MERVLAGGFGHQDVRTNIDRCMYVCRVYCGSEHALFARPFVSGFVSDYKGLANQTPWHFKYTYYVLIVSFFPSLFLLQGWSLDAGDDPY